MTDQVSNPSECFTLVFLCSTVLTEMLINFKKKRKVDPKQETFPSIYRRRNAGSVVLSACVSSGYKQTVAALVLSSGDVLLRLSLLFVPHLLLAWERVVVTRHISHDGLLIGPQGANDVCPGDRGGGKTGDREEREMHNKSKRVQRQKRSSRGRNHERRQRRTQVISSPRQPSPGMFGRPMPFCGNRG